MFGKLILTQFWAFLSDMYIVMEIGSHVKMHKADLIVHSGCVSSKRKACFNPISFEVQQNDSSNDLIQYI